MKVGDWVYYEGYFENCHNHKYEIVKIFKNVFGKDWYYDLRAISPNIKTHHKELLSVELPDIRLISIYQ